MDSSVLFTGLRFNRNQLGVDVGRFHKRKRTDHQESAVNAALENARTVLDSSNDGIPERNASEEHTGVAPDISSQVTSSDETKRRRKRAKRAASDEVNKEREENFTSLSIFKRASRLKESEDAAVDAKPPKSKLQSSARLAEEARATRSRYRLHVNGQNVPAPLKEFNQLKPLYGCKNALLRLISEAGFAEPTPIQRQAIPILLERRQCLACAPTGSGKTLAFILPIVMNLKASSTAGIRAVVLCPIRELAAQIAREFTMFVRGKALRVRVLTTSLFNTTNFDKISCDILISTPVRLELLLKKKKIDLSSVEYLVMDESDKLFEMGFVEQIDSVVAACTSPNVVHALFSATLPDTVEELARTIMPDAIRIIVGEKNSAASTVDQKLLYVGSEDGKLLALRQLFSTSLKPPILLFVQSKERAKQLHRELTFEDIKVDSIHADRSQEQRDKAVEKFRLGSTWVLIATDLMARGMDFKGVNCVINYDVPPSTATYIHRVGRSGRAGRSGQAITLYTNKDVAYLRSIANVIRGAGCEVPQWMLSLRKTKVKKGKKINRASIG